MTWLEHHYQSEQLSSEAEIATRHGERNQAFELYARAAQAEELALQEVEPSKPRTYGITAVSAASLYFKASQWESAKTLAHRCLGSGRLPDFASQQMDELLDAIKLEQLAIRPNSSSMLVSMSGGVIVSGGAPMNLIITKAQKMQALLYRTTEYLKQIPHRRRGEPSNYIQESYQPWLFQAAPGSYQFTVSIQETRQLSMFDTNDVRPAQIIDSLFGILQTCAESPGNKLPVGVDNADYRSTFLKLTRDLAPTGKGFSRLNIRSANTEKPLVLTSGNRDAIKNVIRENRPPSQGESETDVRGILRALHLDSDWIEVRDGANSFRIEQVREEVDDRIGSMVNHPVVVRVAQAGEKLRFLDIETDE